MTSNLTPPSSRLRLMPDYDCFPVWNDRGECLDPATLRISASLRHDLLAWADVYDATLDRQDPARSGFASESQRRAFMAEGLTLQSRLERELGPEARVALKI